ncbi:unnamed protein product [Peniophora sp. CBMAI 1063]|nr:unnamed protein product [Peniophora sp. CBMAI 1063]
MNALLPFRVKDFITSIERLNAHHELLSDKYTAPSIGPGSAQQPSCPTAPVNNGLQHEHRKCLVALRELSEHTHGQTLSDVEGVGGRHDDVRVDGGVLGLGFKRASSKALRDRADTFAKELKARAEALG